MDKPEKVAVVVDFKGKHEILAHFSLILVVLDVVRFKVVEQQDNLDVGH